MRGLKSFTLSILILLSLGAQAASPSLDEFQHLQENAQLPASVRLTPGQHLSLERIQSLWHALIHTPANGRSFAPRTVLARLLREAASRSAPMPYTELSSGLDSFKHLALVRPDGYICGARSGTPIAHLGKVRQHQGELYVQGLRVGAFYFNSGGVFFAVDDSLQRQGDPLGELPLGRDPLTAALLGAEQAGGEILMGLASLFTQHPMRTLEDLGRLPTTLAGLIASSPEYFGRYRDMNLEDQVREASRLATHVLTLLGGAPASGPRMASAARLPRLAVSGAGELVLGGVAEVSGSVAVVGTGILSTSLVVMATSGSGDDETGSSRSWPPAAAGPGRWEQKNESMPDDSREFQASLTGAPPGWVYRIRTGPGPKDHVDYDGFTNGVLLEIKGKGYLALLRSAAGKNWLKAVRDMIDQAKRQYAAAQGVPLRWYFAEKEVADIMRQLFSKENLGKIQVEHATPKK